MKENEQLYMYCRHCGWMHEEAGLGISICGRCSRTSAWVCGTEEELAEFRAAITADPEAYRQFRSTDYWDSWREGK